MSKIDYDLLFNENKAYTHFIAEHMAPNTTMKNIQNHSHYEILYIREGERIMVIEQKQHLLNKNRIALVPPYTLHRTLRSPESTQERYKKYLINFTKGFAEKVGAALDIDIFTAFLKKRRVIDLDDSEARFVEKIMIEMLKYNTVGDTCDEQMFCLLLCSLLTFFAKKVSKETIYKESVLTDKIIAYMESNFQEDITLEFLSKRFYVSKYEISRMFSKNVGISFLEYLTRIRIENSKKLLSKTTLSITKISEVTGFHSSSNFARVFKKVTGISPVMYRKESEHEEE